MGQLLQRWACFVFCLFVIFYLLFLRAKWDKEGRKVVKCARFWREKSHTFSLFSINGWNNIYYYDSWRQKIVFIIYGITLRFFWMAESKLEKFGSLFSKNFAKSMEILWKYVGRHSKPSSIIFESLFFSSPFLFYQNLQNFFLIGHNLRSYQYGTYHTVRKEFRMKMNINDQRKAQYIQLDNFYVRHQRYYPLTVPVR